MGEYRRALELKADYAEAHLNLALALLRLGRREAARESLERYLALVPESARLTQADQIRRILAAPKPR